MTRNSIVLALAAVLITLSPGCKSKDKSTKQGDDKVAKTKPVVDKGALARVDGTKGPDTPAPDTPPKVAAPTVARDCTALPKALLSGAEAHILGKPEAERAAARAKLKQDERLIIDRCTFALSVGVNKLAQAFDCLKAVSSGAGVKVCMRTHRTYALFFMHHDKGRALQPKAGPACLKAVDHVYALLTKSKAPVKDLAAYKSEERESVPYVSALGRCRTYPVKARECVVAATSLDALEACQKAVPFPAKLVRY